MNKKLNRLRSVMESMTGRGGTRRRFHENNGWDRSKFREFKEVYDKLYEIEYEIRTSKRGSYTDAYTYYELGELISDLGDQLRDIGDDISKLDGPDDTEDDE